MVRQDSRSLKVYDQSGYKYKQTPAIVPKAVSYTHLGEGKRRKNCHRKLPHVIRAGSVAGRTESDDYAYKLEKGIRGASLR